MGGFLLATLLELYRYTGERRWLTAATELATRAAASVTASVTAGARSGGTPGARSGVTPGARGYIPGSLHKGELGIAVLAADLTRPEIASMPFFGSMP